MSTPMTADEKRIVVMRHVLREIHNFLRAIARRNISNPHERLTAIAQTADALVDGSLDHMTRVLENLRAYDDGEITLGEAARNDIDAALNYQPATCARCGVTLDTYAGYVVHGPLCPTCYALWQGSE